MDRYQHLSPAQARRRRRLTTLIGLTVLLILIALGVWARFEQLSGGDERLSHQGAKALQRALLGEREAFSEAEAAFSQASRAVVVDAYPVFALELTQQLRRGDVKVSAPELQVVIEHLKHGRIQRSADALSALPNPGRFRWLKRLLEDMMQPGP